ncbi:MAG TPA: NifB/NifX family molybdenum-iron cluster-binding protein [Thermodesulfobacteriota bacterium]|nr:NifB/NifX family molybdenum-iron cluster-binding protein [Thermodesulfobacteriota bacterium]
MKVCVSATAPGLDAQVDSRFGRCQYFAIVDPDTMECESIPNANIAAMGGAGIQSAQFIANKGVGVVLTGNVGPNAHSTLQAAGVEIITGVSGTVRQVIEAYKGKKLGSPVSGPTVASHAGMGNSAQPSGQGIGTGGMGMGGGMGRGGGGGMGGGMGMPSSESYPSGSSPQPAVSKEQELNTLKEQSGLLKEQLDAITDRIEKLERK